ncbi:MAG TPA: ferric reductase-like transmembrane domain-containing protein [Bryobacteraceae bacterium]|jgi:predicted ferric reductase|nr:ferric reductase-like transmembrane domain-containing protein [Bryobacteraceae bacterium]
MDPIDLSATAGLAAMILLTLNILMGLLVSTNYNPARDWPRRKLPWPLWRIHNWTGYLALAVAFAHPLILTFANPKIGRFRLGDILLPISSPGQTFYNVLGALTLYGFAFVVVTSYFRPRLRYRPWKKLHYTAYFAAVTMYIHGMLIDQNLKNQAADLLDGEKVLVEGCLLLVVAASIWRWRRGTEKQRYQKTKSAKAA